MEEYKINTYYPFTKQCAAVIREKLASVYDSGRAEEKWRLINEKYEDYLVKFNRDLGGKKNPRNGAGGTYDCIAFCCLWEVCKDRITLRDIEEMEFAVFSPSFGKLRFLDLNKPFIKRLYYLGEKAAEKRGNKIDDYRMIVEPYDPNGPIRHSFTSCPIAEFTKQFGFEDVLPYLCNADFPCVEMLHGKLVRKHTLGNGDICDYAICGDKDPYLKEHEEYRDENGYRRNK